jgi:sigma-B regulation protein RsbU (phosphoserine phosphatase)
MHSIVDFLSRQSKAALFVIAFVSAVVIGFFDYITGQDYYFFIFYAIPIFLITWYIGKPQGYMMSLFCLVAWFLDDTLNRPVFADPFVPMWNIFVKFGFYIMLIEALSALKQSLEREKETELRNIEHELDIARQVQQRLFPQSAPEMLTLDYCGVCKPASKIGGDYYDYFLLGKGRLALAIGDVCGHGISASLLMASVEAFVRSNSHLYGDNLKTFIREMNSFLYQSTEDSKFVTFFYSVYDDKTRKMVYVNAGHNPPFLLNRNGFEKLDKGGLLLGAVESAEYEQGEVNLGAGDLLLLYTDGITEAMNVKEELFGDERLEKTVSGNRSGNAESVKEYILETLKKYAGSHPQEDDITMIVAKGK